MKFTCPYCHTKSVPPPVGDERYQQCGNCEAWPRAVRVQSGDKLLIKYVSTARPKKDPQDVKHPRGLKVSDRVMEKLKSKGFDTAQQYFDYCITLDVFR